MEMLKRVPHQSATSNAQIRHTVLFWGLPLITMYTTLFRGLALITMSWCVISKPDVIFQSLTCYFKAWRVISKPDFDYYVRYTMLFRSLTLITMFGIPCYFEACLWLLRPDVLFWGLILITMFWPVILGLALIAMSWRCVVQTASKICITKKGNVHCAHCNHDSWIVYKLTYFRSIFWWR